VGDLGKLLVLMGGICCHRRAGADVDWTNQPADWAASWGHGLSREEHDILFSAGYFDCGELGALDFVVCDWAVAKVVLSSRFLVLG
jgi:hypothetical protein